MKRVLLINDLACKGECSMLINIPILKAMNTNIDIIPISLFSTHTAFKEFYYKDLTKEAKNIYEHFKKINDKYEATYIGYLGDEAKIDLVDEILASHNSLTLLDPIMGDDGKLYKKFNSNYPKKLLKLINKANIITPNLTEACLILGIEYKPNFTILEIKEMLQKLSELGPEIVIITSVVSSNEVINYLFDSKNNKIEIAKNPRIRGKFYGTGDLFSSLFLGFLLNDFSLESSLVNSSNLVYKVINNEPSNYEPLEGIKISKIFKDIGSLIYE